MPTKLSAPDVGKAIHACGRIVSVNKLTSGVMVEVRDDIAGTTIGHGFTPNEWGNDWDPVVTGSLTDGHKITARQLACTGVESPYSAAQTTNPDPSPVTVPTLDPPIVGNDTITAHHLLTGSELKALDHATWIGSGLSTAESNWMSVHPNIAASSSITAEQTCARQASRRIRQRRWPSSRRQNWSRRSVRDSAP
jgi:hypothetical protein